MKDRTCAIIVAAGKGSRMGADCPKQFIEVYDKPILYYTIKAFEKSEVDEIIIVTSKEYQTYVEKDIVKRYGFKKVVSIVEGGKERYLSVYEGIKSLKNISYVLIHDGARPFIQPKLINKTIEEVEKYNAVVVGVKSKDTVKIVDEDGFVSSTPNRECVWNIQTPQAFSYNLLKTAYDKVIEQHYSNATDDAMVVEYATRQSIKLLEGDYSNIKITTPEDLQEEKFRTL